MWNTWQSEYWNTVHFRLASEGFWEKLWRISNEILAAMSFYKASYYHGAGRTTWR
jgi:hypothetical protein